MSVSAILFVNERGDIVISRFYRDDVKRPALDSFRALISSKKISAPVVQVDDCSFLVSRHGDVYVVAITKLNSNSALIFQFLFNLVDVFKAYFGGKFNEEQIRRHFVLIYELLDETMDHGYPQITAVNILTEYIKVGEVKEKRLNQGGSDVIDPGITGAITGTVDWRHPNKYKYRKNEVFLDVLESVNLLMSTKGDILRSDVSGKIVMKTYLSGMPECKFGLNDKLVMERENKQKKKKRRTAGIAIDDVTFHRCVKLNQFDIDRTINFVPPDGEFELMKYRITTNVNLPFQLTHREVREHGRSRVEYEITLKGSFSGKLFANNVLMSIPTPTNAAKSNVTVGLGKAKYNAAKNAIIWKIKKFPGGASYSLHAEVKLAASISDKQWSRPPITLNFQVPMFTSSGLHVRFLRVFERSNYETTKWVRYMTRAGQYQIRI